MSAAASSSRPLPRPLRLASTSTGPSGSLSPPPSSSGRSSPLSAPLSLDMTEMTNPSSDFNASTSASTGASASASAATRLNPRRQSSISYNTSASSKVRPPSGLGRSSSLGSRAAFGASCGRDENGVVARPPSLVGVRETEPVTLAERHADLLRFIAQKESKCLELRTQLAQHEADLLLLKRKWERIVSKGLPSTARSDVSTTLGSDMFDGIREGVQHGLGKMFAVLEPSSATGPTQGSSVALPPLDSRRHSQQRPRLENDSTPAGAASSGKRGSIGTASSSSTRDRSSVSGSLSSSGSLFDELSPSDHQSLASSVEDESTVYPGPESKRKQMSVTTRPCQTTQNSASLVETGTERLNADDNPSSVSLSRKRWPAPSSLTISQFSYPFAASVPSDLTPLGRQVANWVPPSLNKKWEELKGSETLSKQSKRASVLLNDVLAVLAPPPSSLPKTPASTESTGKAAPMKPPLDSANVGLSPSMAPSPLDLTLPLEVKAPGTPRETTDGSKKEDDKEEEEWNW